MDKYSFQNCQKIVVFSPDNKKVLLARRKGEKDYDEVYSFIGGKMEVSDKNIVEGLRREKTEEVGSKFIIALYPVYNVMNFYVKKDGNSMILPHFYARHVRGEIKLNSEYSDYKWIPVSELKSFEPKIPTILDVVKRLLQIIPLVKEEDLVEI
jgi:ADP-ribose pyrophosphatase YjhB (NUDIX family)